MKKTTVAEECMAKSRNRGIHNGCTGAKPIHQELQGKHNKE